MRSERWSTHSEIMNALKADAAGPVLLYENGHAYVYSGEGHSLFLGVSGCGKSRRGTYPLTMSIIRNRASACIIDPKGELWAYTQKKIPSDYNVHVINFRNLFDANAEGWNPLRAPYELWHSGTGKGKYIAEQMIEELAYILYPEAVHSDPFWSQQAREVFLGATYVLFELAKPSEVSLASVHNLISKGEERYGSTSYLRELIRMLEESDLDNKENITMQLHSYVTTAEDTRGGIRSVFMNGLALATRSESIRRFLSHDELNINSLRGDKPTLIYIIVPDESPNFDELAGVLVSQVMNHYIRIAEQDYQGKLPIRLHCIIEEAGNIARALPNLDHYMTAARSRNIKVEFVLQSLSQLEIYGKAKAQTILANADTIIAYRTINRETLEELSFRCGDREVFCDDRLSREPLCTPCQLSQLETGQALIIISGRTKYITKLPDFTEMSISHYCPKKTATVKKSRKTKVSYFDIISFVKKVKSNRINICDIKRNEKAIPKPILDACDESLTPIIDLDELIKHIDDQIKALETAKEDDQTHRVKVDCTMLDRIDEVAKVISDHTNRPLTEVRIGLYEERNTYYDFDTYSEAMTFINLVKKAGADATLVTNDE